MTDSEWENQFRSWAEPPSKTEQTRCDNAISAVRNAVSNSEPLKYTTKVFVQGSYRNRVNVKKDSDVDIGVLYTGSYFLDLLAGGQDPLSGAASYDYASFKNDLETALRSHFKMGVERGNKAIKLRENTYHVDADVAPLFHLKKFGTYGEFLRGVSLVPDDGSRRIDNYPERLADDWPNVPLHYENGVEKNSATSRRYKSATRIVKKLCNTMADEGNNAAKVIPGYLIECLIYNAPNSYFGANSWLELVRSIFCYIWVETKLEGDCSKWTEVDRIKFLFHSSQPWTKEQAHAFVDTAWDRIGVKSA
ncbi:MAG: nucleotidyltransferase [Phycisphaeraceae bacterium]|nr:nucleotidyltransferase [Phycisphaeraceae bacterium]